VITVVAASTASNVSSVAFAVSARTHANGSGWDDFEKPLDMLLEEELEMWKEKENDSMDKGAQEDEQFEVEIALAKIARRIMIEVIQIELPRNGYQVLCSKHNKQRTKYSKCASDKAFKNQVW